MKKNALFVLFLMLLTITGLSLQNARASTFPSGDNPEEEGGDGFVSGDPCGFLMGNGSSYTNASTGRVSTVSFKNVDNVTVANDNNQACVQQTGYFYSSSTRSSTAGLRVQDGSATNDYIIHFAGSWANPAVMDQSTGAWSGYGRITSASFPGTSDQRWVWFDWTCSTSACSSQAASKYYVNTDLDTGNTEGYAWNDYFGFIHFGSSTGSCALGDGSCITWELPPHTVYMSVDVLASDDASRPSDVSYENAPLADGHDYWRVKVEFQDADTLEYLTASEITSLTITPSSSGHVFVNQVQDTGDAITETPVNSYLGCSSSDSCVLSESDAFGTWNSWNTFVMSAAPTSNVLGLNDDTDTGLEYYSDREGCRYIYYDQYALIDGKAASMDPCPNVTNTWATATVYSKDDVYYDRVNDRNQYLLDALTIDVTFADSTTVVELSSNQTQISSTEYTHEFSSPYELSFRPRYQITGFVASYDGRDHDEISSDLSKLMMLETTATVANTSLAYQDAVGVARPAYDVYYQLDAEPDSSDHSAGDTTLIMDTGDSDSIADCSYRTDSVAASYGPAGAHYTASYAMNYGQRSSVTCNGLTSSPTNTLSNPQPTAEQWVCDNIVSAQGTPCYYTAYLPRIDRHTDPEDMMVLGAINSTIDQSAYLDNDESLSMLGATDTIKLRNTMYAQIVRYTLGMNASGVGHLDSNMEDSSGAMLSLMGGRLLYGEDDVVIDGSSSFSGQKTVVTIGGNVLIRGNIGSEGSGGRLGVIAFKDSDGNGGNVYVDPSVTDLYANFFLDGALLSYDGVTVPTYPVEFDWGTVGGDETRLSTLFNQLYLNGSLVARNTILDPDSAPNGSSPATSWALGDGTSSVDYPTAREHDLNQVRQYRRCYAVNPDGTLDTSTILDCDEGEQLSNSTTAQDLAAAGSYPSFILEYAPSDELPIFRAESGLFH